MNATHLKWMRNAFLAELLISTVWACIISPLSGIVCFIIWSCSLLMAPKYFARTGFAQRALFLIFWSFGSCVFWGIGTLSPSITRIYVSSRIPAVDGDLLINGCYVAALLFIFCCFVRLLTLGALVFQENHKKQ